MSTLPEQIEGAVAPKMIFTLGLAGLCSGLAIVLVYLFTLPMIEANRAEALRAAVFKVVPASNQMQKMQVVDGALAAVADDAEGPAIYAAYDAEGKFVGYAIPSQGSGFQDTIRLLYGYEPGTKTVVGMEILESKETPGLGDKIFKDMAFVGCFAALSVEPEIVCVKNGEKSAPNEVDGISGATISSKAVCKILNAGNAEWLGSLPEPGAEPELRASEGGQR